MDAFADNFDQTEVDPAAEFLAREKDQLAGLEDELNADTNAIGGLTQGTSALNLDSGMLVVGYAQRAHSICKQLYILKGQSIQKSDKKMGVFLCR